MAQLEVELARAILASEPRKRREGSKARQRWIGVSLMILQALMKYGYDEAKFRQALMEEEVE